MEVGDKLDCSPGHEPADDDDADYSRNGYTWAVRTCEEDNRHDAGQLQDACAWPGALLGAYAFQDGGRACDNAPFADA